MRVRTVLQSSLGPAILKSPKVQLSQGSAFLLQPFSRELVKEVRFRSLFPSPPLESLRVCHVLRRALSFSHPSKETNRNLKYRSGPRLQTKLAYTFEAPQKRSKEIFRKLKTTLSPSTFVSPELLSQPFALRSG